MIAGAPIGALLHLACVMVYGALAALVVARRPVSRTGMLLAAASLLTGAWALAVALRWPPSDAGIPGLLDLVRAGAWYAFVAYLYRQTATPASRLGPTITAAATMLALVVAATPWSAVLPHAGWGGPRSIQFTARIGVAIGSILLIENLYLSTPAAGRWHINLACIAIGGFFLYDLLLYSDALMFGRVSEPLFEARASATALVAPLLAVAAARNRRWNIDIHVSRQVAFHSATLVGSGVFLLALAGVGEVLRDGDAAWGVVFETSIVFGGLVAISVVVTSGSARSWVQVLVVDHFFSHRYDYRREWIRCIDALSLAEPSTGLQGRAIRAIAEVVDSPGGALFLREPTGVTFTWAGSWNVPAAATPVAAADPLVVALQEGRSVLDLGQLAAWPAWLDALEDVWVAAPLNHCGKLIGFVLVTRPRAPRALDREALELLGVVGREVASRLAEHQVRAVLAQTRDLHEYGKRFAFVVHDIKNVSSQLSMLLANAERHADDPAFQRDMLHTVRASAAKISVLLSRLQSREPQAIRTAIAPVERLAELLDARNAAGADISMLEDGRDAPVIMDPAAFDSVITHLLDNAVEAARGGAPVVVAVRHETSTVCIDITDDGLGMTAEFVRDRLFAPFASTKRSGHGIGAFQARDLLRGAGGDLLVISRPGAGTTMRVLLPTAARPVARPVAATV